MKKILPASLFLILASTVVPFAVSGSPDDTGERWHFTKLVESVAVSRNGERLGDVEDVVFDDQGKVLAVLLDQRLASEEDTPDPVSEGRRRSMHEELFAVGMEGARFETEPARLTLSVETLDDADYSQDQKNDPVVGRFRGSTLIGARVNLADEDDFGKVNDILIDPGNARAEGFVVETGALLGDTHVMPPLFKAYDRDAAALNFAITRKDARRTRAADD